MEQRDKPMIELKDRWSGLTLFTSDTAATLCEAVLEAVKAGADLCRANLCRANLSGANLSGANLSGANLSGANLSGAYISGANLSRANLYGADFSGASLYRANLYGADLSEANLYGADLYGANLYGADFYGADLFGANLYGADFSGASLYGAKNVQPERYTALLCLLDQPGKIRLYKLVNSQNEGPYNGGIVYEIGKTISVPDANTDPLEQCGAGINVATLDWCLKEWREGYKVLVVEFTAQDIACIPTATDGKVRLFKCKVIGEKDISAIVAPPPEADESAKSECDYGPNDPT